jgi:hypothetical protein
LIFNKNNKKLILLGSLFFFTRAVLIFLGVQYDVSPLGFYSQIIDPQLLKTRLFESLYYLHFQPPLFNLFIGVVLKLFPEQYPLVFNACYFFLGLLFVFTIFTLMEKMKVNVKVNFFLTILFMINPAVILYENLLLYTYPVAVLLCLTALIFYRYLETEKGKDALLFFLLLATLILLRGFFNIFWFLILLFWLMLLKQHKIKQILSAAIIPLILIVTLNIKNYCIVGNLSPNSTFLGIQLANITIPFLTDEELREAIKNKGVTRTTFMECDKPRNISPRLSKYFSIKKTGIPVLDRPNLAGNNDIPNLNSLFALKVSQIYLRESLYVLKHYPQAYFRGLRRAIFIYLLPSPTDVKLRNRRVVFAYEKFYNFMFYEGYANRDWFHHRTYLGLTCLILVTIGYSALHIFALKIICTAKKNSGNSLWLNSFIFIYFNILYVSIIAIALGPGATNRYRFAIDAFYLILSGMLLTNFYPHIRLFFKAIVFRQMISVE